MRAIASLDRVGRAAALQGDEAAGAGAGTDRGVYFPSSSRSV